MSAPNPLYTPSNSKPAYRLYWSLSVFWNQPAPDAVCWLPALSGAVEPDGVRVLGHRFKRPDVGQFLLSTKPHVPPPAAIRSIKGRLQYLVRGVRPKAFRRNYAIYSIGAVSRAVVENYIRSQVNHHPMADERVETLLGLYQIRNSGRDLAEPRQGAHGKFLYNLHLVFVHRGRWCEIREDVLRAAGRNVAARFQRAEKPGTLKTCPHISS